MSDATTNQQQLSDELDAALLEAVREARKTKSGNAALFNAATARLKALGLTKVVDANCEAGQLAREFGLEDPDVLKFPTEESLEKLMAEA